MVTFGPTKIYYYHLSHDEIVMKRNAYMDPIKNKISQDQYELLVYHNNFTKQRIIELLTSNVMNYIDFKTVKKMLKKLYSQ